MNRLNSSYIKFYVITIALVAVLFSAVTSYGEKNLQAPPRLSGSYKIEAGNLPNCLKDKSLLLVIQQSGIYISGDLQSDSDRSESKSVSQDNFPLAGRWQDGKFSIAGAVTQVEGCDRAKQLAISGTPTNKELEGQISFAGNTSNFTALLQEPKRKSSPSH
jgi:hypothetical protein